MCEVYIKRGGQLLFQGHTQRPPRLSTPRTLPAVPSQTEHAHAAAARCSKGGRGMKHPAFWGGIKIR